MPGSTICVMLVAVALTAVTLAGHPADRPALTLLGTAPLVVHGTGFRRRERIRVRVHSPGTTARRRVRAGRRGRFTVRFGAGVASDPCSGLFITAVGATGNRALL